MKWSVAALGGAVATIIMIGVTLAEFTLIPTTWNNSSHLTRRLFFLLVTLALTAGPSVYILLYDNGKNSNLPLILGIVQFFLGVVAALLFGIIPSGRMFGNRVASKSRKYLASQTFAASYPALSREARATSILLWVLIFGCKLTESYFFLTVSFGYPIQVMVGMKVQACTTKYIGDGLCKNQVAFTLAIMYFMDLVLFFLDTFLWYVIWSTVFSIGRSFALGLSIWTPWNKIYSRLPKRIYAKLLATEDMNGRYKPKVCNITDYAVLTSCSRISIRFSSPKYGMRLSSPCIESIYSPSTTFRSFCTTRFRARTIEGHFERRLSFWRKETLNRLGNFSRLNAAKRNVAYRSLPNLSLLPCPRLCPSTPCQPSQF